MPPTVPADNPAATARRGVPAVRTGSRRPDSPRRSCGVPVAICRQSRQQGNRADSSDGATVATVTPTGSERSRVWAGKQGDGFGAFRSAAPFPWRSSDGDGFGNRADGNRRNRPAPDLPTVPADSLPTVTRQTHRNRPPWRSRRSDGFAPVPICRRALWRSCAPWRRSRVRTIAAPLAPPLQGHLTRLETGLKPSRRSDGFAPVPICRRALCRSCAPWRQGDGFGR